MRKVLKYPAYTLTPTLSRQAGEGVSARFLPILAALFLAVSFPASAETLRIGLTQDPDVLDPALNHTAVGGIVLKALCDRIFEATVDKRILPGLASSYAWSADYRQLTITLKPGLKFPDGEPLDAEAVKFTIERDLTFPGSRLKPKFPPLDGIEILDAGTVRIDLKSPFPPIIEVLSSYSGIVLAPKATRAMGESGTGDRPPCIGAFRVTERVPQDRIVLERVPDYWDAARIKLDRLVFLPITDNYIRVTNLKSGDLDLITGVTPQDFLDLAKDPDFGTASAVQLGYSAIVVNVGSDAMADNPLGRDPRVRKALDLALDREALSQVLSGGLSVPDNQMPPPDSPYHDPALPAPKRDLERAKALLAEAGVPHPSFTLMLLGRDGPDPQGEMIQAMAAEAGFEIKLLHRDFTTSLDAATRGNFQAFSIGWSGFIDPDGNASPSLRTDGPYNYAHYSSPEADTLLEQGRSTASVEARQAIYAKLAALLARDLPILYLGHSRWLWAFSNKVQGFEPAADSNIRFKNLTKS